MTKPATRVIGHTIWHLVRAHSATFREMYTLGTGLIVNATGMELIRLQKVPIMKVTGNKILSMAMAEKLSQVVLNTREST